MSDTQDDRKAWKVASDAWDETLTKTETIQDAWQRVVDRLIAHFQRQAVPVVYQCPRCTTAMQVDPTAKPSQSISADMVMVPREPTNSMTVAGTIIQQEHGGLVRSIWQAMIAAAPTKKEPT